MAVTQTNRLGVYRWSVGTDTFTRNQMDTSHQNIEMRAAGYEQGVSRPVASTDYQGFIYFDTAADVLSYCDGTNWFNISEFGSVSGLSVGGSTSDGVATTVARSDHTHSLPGFGTPINLTGLSSSSAGTSGNFARADHEHGIDSGSIVALMIAAGAVEEAALDSDSVSTGKLQDGSVTDPKISSMAASKLTGTASVDTTGSAATLSTGRTFELTGEATGTSAAFDGSANVSISVSLPNAADMSGSDGAGRKISVSATQPSSPATGDLWVDIS